MVMFTAGPASSDASLPGTSAHADQCGSGRPQRPCGGETNGHEPAVVGVRIRIGVTLLEAMTAETSITSGSTAAPGNRRGTGWQSIGRPWAVTAMRPRRPCCRFLRGRPQTESRCIALDVRFPTRPERGSVEFRPAAGSSTGVPAQRARQSRPGAWVAGATLERLEVTISRSGGRNRVVDVVSHQPDELELATETRRDDSPCMTR